MDALKKQVSFLEKKNTELEQKLFELQQQFEEFSSKASSKSNVKKQPSEKKTNHPGPGAWNEFVKVIWRDMLEEQGHELPEDDDEFRKFAAKNGIAYKQALTEAAIRKAAKEGKEFVPKPAKAKSNKNDGADDEEEELLGEASIKNRSPKAPELWGEDEDEELTKEMKSIGCAKKKIDDVVYYVNTKTKEVFNITADRV
jgi:hypothetical protein